MDIQTTLVFNISKIYQKEISKRPQFFAFQNHTKICAITSVFNLNCTQKINQNNVDFSSMEIRSKKVHRNDVDISVIEVTPNKVRRNDVDFLLIEITSKKVRRNDVEICQYFLFDVST